MKMSEIREMSIDELRARVESLEEELFKLKFQHGIRQLENTASLSALRKDIARVKTVINEKNKAKAA